MPRRCCRRRDTLDLSRTRPLAVFRALAEHRRPVSVGASGHRDRPRPPQRSSQPPPVGAARSSSSRARVPRRFRGSCPFACRLCASRRPREGNTLVRQCSHRAYSALSAGGLASRGSSTHAGSAPFSSGRSTPRQVLHPRRTHWRHQSPGTRPWPIAIDPGTARGTKPQAPVTSAKGSRPVSSVYEDVANLQRHLEFGRCDLAAVVVFTTRTYFIVSGSPAEAPEERLPTAS